MEKKSAMDTNISSVNEKAMNRDCLTCKCTIIKPSSVIVDIFDHTKVKEAPNIETEKRRVNCVYERERESSTQNFHIKSNHA